VPLMSRTSYASKIVPSSRFERLCLHIERSTSGVCSTAYAQ
jgi:hypothetical protein